MSNVTGVISYKLQTGLFPPSYIYIHTQEGWSTILHLSHGKSPPAQNNATVSVGWSVFTGFGRSSWVTRDGAK